MTVAFRIAAVFTALLLAGRATAQPTGDVCEAARSLVKERAVGLDAPDLATVRSLIRTLCARDVFVKVDRRLMARWHRDPASRAAWLERLRRIQARITELRNTASRRLLTGNEAEDLARAEQTGRVMQRREEAWQAVYARVPPADYPFVLTGRRALELGVLDGCTSASRVFGELARAAGIEVRLVGSSDLTGLGRIWRRGEKRAEGGVNGHKMALVRLAGQWFLVNTNFHQPARPNAYEIMDSLGGKPVRPETLVGTVLRLPSMQVADGRRSPALLVTQVAPPGAPDLGEFTREANLNLAVSGDPTCAICRNPVVARVLEDPALNPAGRPRPERNPAPGSR